VLSWPSLSSGIVADPCALTSLSVIPWNIPIDYGTLCRRRPSSLFISTKMAALLKRITKPARYSYSLVFDPLLLLRPCILCLTQSDAGWLKERAPNVLPSRNRSTPSGVQLSYHPDCGLGTRRLRDSDFSLHLLTHPPL
jgi:hypothetical protein